MKCADVQRALRNLGFVMEPRTGTSHEKWRATINGVLRKVTVACHRGEVHAKDVKSIIGQAGVTKQQWAEACGR